MERHLGRATSDPHVISLTYQITHADHVDFKMTSPRTADRAAFRVTLDGGKARVEMIEHFASAEEARAAVKPFLDAWELAADVEHPEDRLRFVYERAEVVDRSPSGRGVALGGMIAASASMHAVLHTSRSKWPEPPADLGRSPEVETLHLRWLACLDKKERLLAATYLALSMIEAAPGPLKPDEELRDTKKRHRAAEHFNIEPKVLKTLGHLTANRGGPEDARKAEGTLTPLSREERKWLQAAFKALVKQAALRAHYEPNPPPVPLTMKDLSGR
jgi:hypothetical protein